MYRLPENLIMVSRVEVVSQLGERSGELRVFNAGVPIIIKRFNSNKELEDIKKAIVSVIVGFNSRPFYKTTVPYLCLADID